MTDQPSGEFIAAASALARTFAETWNEQNGPGYAAAYWPDAELVDPTGAVWDGREAIEQMHVDLWNGPARNTKVEASVRRVRALGPDMVLVDLAIAVSGFTPPPPGAAVDARGQVKARLKHVVERRGSDWKIIASQNTFVSGPPETH